MSDRDTERVPLPPPTVSALPLYIRDFLVTYWRFYAVALAFVLALAVVTVVFSKPGPREWAYQASPNTLWKLGEEFPGDEWPKEWPDIIVQTEPLRVVSPIYHQDPHTGKRLGIMEKDNVPLSRIERYVSVTNTTGGAMAVKIRCTAENESDGIRERFYEWDTKLVFVGAHGFRRIRMWFFHYTMYKQVYRMPCRWDVAELKGAVISK